MLFSENFNLFNHSLRTLQTDRQTDRQRDRQDYYTNTALCTILHREVIKSNATIVIITQVQSSRPPKSKSLRKLTSYNV